MNKKVINIEQLYSESFIDFRVKPSSGLWKSISSKLAWRNFFSFTPTTINAWYVAGLLTIATAGVLLITKPGTENNPETKEITINNTIENSVITPLQENEPESEEVTTQEESRKVEAGSRKPAFSSEVSTKVDSSSVIVSKPDNKKPTVTPIALTKINTKKLLPDTQHIASSAVALAKADTPHPTPKTHTETSNQQPATSNQSPDPWPNAMDSLFINYNSTVPEYKIEFPNAFTPNPNGSTNGYYTPGLPNNDVFHPVYKGVVEYHLSIYNRRGELIFESNEITTGWDGYINSHLATQGVYVWKARGKYSNGQNFIKAGNVMLIIK